MSSQKPLNLPISHHEKKAVYVHKHIQEDAKPSGQPTDIKKEPSNKKAMRQAAPSQILPKNTEQKAGAVPLPAEVVGPAHVAQLQAVGLVLVLVGAGGDDGLPPALGASLVLAGAEEEAVGVLAGHAVEELAQGFVAFPPAAVLGGRDLLAAGGDVARAQALAVVVQVAGFGRVQAVVALGVGGRVHSCPESKVGGRGEAGDTSSSPKMPPGRGWHRWHCWAGGGCTAVVPPSFHPLRDLEAFLQKGKGSRTRRPG